MCFDRQTEIADSLVQIVMKVHGVDVTRGQLRDAFDRVSPPNWKERIDATVITRDGFEAEMIRQAVTFFTGSVPTLERVRSRGVKAPRCKWRVKTADTLSHNTLMALGRWQTA
jgi:hypothetical protein